MSGSFLLVYIYNRHIIGYPIVCVSGILIIHFKRECFCSYGGLSAFSLLNIYINTLGGPLVRYARSDGLDFFTLDLVWLGGVKTTAATMTMLLLRYGLPLALRIGKEYPYHTALWLSIAYLVAWKLSRLQWLYNPLVSKLRPIALYSIFLLVESSLFSQRVLGKINRYLKEVEFQKRRQSRPGGPLRTYRAVQTGQIRFLRIRRRTPFAKLQCELIHTSFDEAPVYTAISYSWGDATPTHEILIDGCRAPINSTVYDILHHQRSYLGETTLWIDSICINQGNNEERGEQVLLMKDIF